MSNEDIVRDEASLRDFIKRTRALIASKSGKLNLEPRVLAHFNFWADETIAPLFLKEGLSLQPATTARYDPDRRGFEIELGEIHREGRQFYGDFFDDEIYEAICGYEEQTPWVYNVETHFDLPK